MEYNPKLWNEYTDDNRNILENPSEFIYHVCLSLGANSVLEAGCNVGNSLRHFPTTMNIQGFDLNDYALKECQSRYPKFKFKKGSLLEFPYNDNSFDLIFTRTVLIHIPNEDMEKVMNEMLRVSKKWIMNLEFYGKTEEMVKWKRGDDLLWHRNMEKRWKNFNVEIISDVQLPEKMDPSQLRLTLIKKL